MKKRFVLDRARTRLLCEDNHEQVAYKESGVLSAVSLAASSACLPSGGYLVPLLGSGQIVTAFAAYLGLVAYSGSLQFRVFSVRRYLSSGHQSRK